MFRFIHTADAHIDSPLNGLEAYDGAPLTALRGATRRAFENLVVLALDERVDFVVISGDLYDGDWKDYSTGLFFSRQMARLHSAGIPVYLISGNHDAASIITRRLSLPENVRQFSTRTAETREVAGLPVALHGQGFPNRAVPENLVPGYPPPVPGQFNLGLLHTSLTGAHGHDTYAPCSLRDLVDKGYQYWALGHVHRPQVLHEAPWVVYPGNLQGRDAGETGPRGCQLVTVDDGLEVASAEAVALDVVRWARVPIELAGVADEREAFSRIGAALGEAAGAAEGRLVAARIELAGATPLHDRLRQDPQRLRAECINQAQMVAGEGVWVEEVVTDTTTVADLGELAARDDLTRVVLEILEEAGVGDLVLPAQAVDMLGTLPSEIREVVEADLAQETRAVLLDDVRAILLEALAHKGSQS